MKKKSRRHRRLVLRSIEHKLSPQPSFTPPRPTSPWDCGEFSLWGLEDRSDKRAQAGTHCLAADGSFDHFQTSKSRSQRRPVFVFEQRNTRRHERDNEKNILEDEEKRPRYSKIRISTQVVANNARSGIISE